MNEKRLEDRLTTLTKAVALTRRRLAKIEEELEAALADLAGLPARTHYSISEAASVLGVSRSTINRRLLDETLLSVKISGRRLIPADQIDLLRATY